MGQQKHVFRGILAGVAGGLAAAWVMNEFSTGPGKELTKAVQTDEENRKQEQQASQQGDQDDATMKAADAIVSTATGEHLSKEQKQTAGPVVHYAFGAIMGGIYGGLGEVLPAVRSGFGTSFATALFSGADLVAVPALRLSGSPEDQPKSALVTPYASHLVYGITTELVRRLVRAAL